MIETVSDGPGAVGVSMDGVLTALSGRQLLTLAVDRLLGEVPAALPEQCALDRLRTMIVCGERLQAAKLAAVRDAELRQLHLLDAAGSTRGWLRTQLGGEDGQLSCARRIAVRPHVQQALAGGQVSARAASQLCAVLDKVPTQVGEELLRGVLLDGVGGLLQTYTGGLVLSDAFTGDLLAARAEVEQVLAGCCADTLTDPAGRLEPALVLLARRLAPGHLGPALRQLLDALLPDGSDGDSSDPYFFELRTLLDGDVDVYGHLDPDTGQALAREVNRRFQQIRAAAEQTDPAEPAGTDGADNQADGAGTDKTATGADHPEPHPIPELVEPVEPVEPVVAVDLLEAVEPVAAAEPVEPVEPAEVPGSVEAVAPPRLPCTAGRQRHDALAQLLRDLSDTEPFTGQPAPACLTLIATVDAVEGRLGALPGLLLTDRRPATLSTAALQRLGCYSELTAVLLDALGNPVGASGTHRSATTRERKALLAQWGPGCIITGCTNPDTVPHHVEPWWKTRQTRLRDLAPVCTHCHHDLHEGHATLRLRDGRLINDQGWVTPARE